MIVLPEFRTAHQVYWTEPSVVNAWETNTEHEQCLLFSLDHSATELTKKRWWKSWHDENAERADEEAGIAILKCKLCKKYISVGG